MYPWAIPIRNKEAVPVKNAFAHIYKWISNISNQIMGKSFTNETFETYLKIFNIEHILGSTYYPKSQGAIEALNKTIQEHYQLLLIILFKESNKVFRIRFLIIYAFLQLL